MKISAVIFDLDGTLLNTLEDLTGSVNEILRRHGKEARTRQQVRRSLGNGAANLLAESLPEGRDTPDFDGILAEYVAYYQAHCEEHTGPFDGAVELLERMQEQGIPAAIVSNKGDGAVRRLCRRHFGSLVHAAVGEREGIARKPAPDSVLEAMHQLGSVPEETLYVGDSEVDALTARAAGVHLALVTWGYRDLPQLTAQEPEYLVTDMEQLSALILGRQGEKRRECGA